MSALASSNSGLGRVPEYNMRYGPSSSFKGGSMDPKVATRPRSAIRSLVKSEAGGGIVLMASAALALAIANSRVADTYFAALKLYVGGLSILHWVNDGLMALFFLLIGLEIKRELVAGQLS